jgi:hypothetical protein
MAIRSVLLSGMVATSCLLAACGGSDGPSEPAPPQINSSFAAGVDGWVGGFADYHTETAPTDVVWQARDLPAPLTGKGYYTGGTNRSDDLFIYNKRKFGGYKPSQNYNLGFKIELVTNQSSGCFGVGGAPGESVYVVAGAAPTEPKTVLTGGQYTLNLPRGNQATPGTASQVLGNVANSVPNCGTPVYEAKIVKSTVPLVVKSDANGDIWVFFGIDSGFEAKSTVYYKSVQVSADLLP